MFAAWEDITPLARNEFICWVTDAKKPETRARRIVIARDKLHKGERRPCCWIGCIHRLTKLSAPRSKESSKSAVKISLRNSLVV